MAKCFSCGKIGCDNDGDLCRSCHNIVCVTCAKKYTHWLNGEHGRRPTKRAVDVKPRRAVKAISRKPFGVKEQNERT